jgi:hypothetical protein
VVTAITAYLSARFLVRYFQTRTLTPLRDLLPRLRRRQHPALRTLNPTRARPYPCT